MAEFMNDGTVKYVNKDFQTLKRDLVAYAQSHFSGSFQDFNESSPGMAILELQAYIGDVLSFYMDQQFLEMKQDTARQIANVESFAKQLGYRPRGPRAARVMEKFIIELPATLDSSNTRVPDYTYAPILRAGAQVTGPNSQAFETLADIDFSMAPSDIVVSRSGTNGDITHFAVRKEVECIAGSTVTDTVTVTDFVPYKRIPLTSENVQEILSVTDSDGNTWYEVDYLSQNTVFSQVTNTGSDSDTVPYVMKLLSAPRRFVVDYSVADNTTNLQFGPGQGLVNDDDLIPNIANMSLPISGRTTLSNFSLDPQNFLKTRSLGLSPYNLTLTIMYRAGGGAQTNVPSRTINKVTNVTLDFRSSALSPTSMATIRNSLECVNLIASEGGGPAEKIDEIKMNAGSHFAAQRRCVTREDYLTHVLSMPEKFGRPERAFIKPSDNDPHSIDLYVLSLDINGNLTAPTMTLKKNIITWLSKLRMITEGVNVLNGSVINIGVNFGIVISPRKNRSEVMTNCLNEVKTYLDTAKLQIGQPIVKSDLLGQLQVIDGVVSVYKLDFVALFDRVGGLTYSTDVSSFDVQAATKYGIIMCPPGAIFEVRHPENDIVGESR